MVYPFIQMTSGAAAFYYPAAPSHPQWNIIYPKSELEASQQEREEAKKIYSSVNCVGHYYSKEKNKIAKSTDAFFFHPGGFSSNLKLNSGNAFAKEIDDLELFSKLVMTCFEISGRAESEFANKMQIIRNQTESKFFAYYINGEEAGVWSTFKSSEKFDFLMNFGLLKKFRGQGHSEEMVYTVCKNSQRTLITHSNNPILIQKAFPNLGFKNVGEFQIYEI